MPKFIDLVARLEAFLAKVPDEVKSEGSAIVKDISAEGNRLEQSDSEKDAKIRVLEDTNRAFGAESKQRKIKLQEAQ